MAAVRTAIVSLRSIGPRERAFADFLTSASKGFVAANEASQSFPSVAKRTGALGYGLVCGPRPVRAGEDLLRIPPALWVPYCAESAVRKAEAGAPDVLARLSNACAVASGGGNASTLATVSCLALEILFALERNADEPYLSLLWESLLSESCLPHPLLMDSRHFDHLQASPLRDSTIRAARLYTNVHRRLFGLEPESSTPGTIENEKGMPPVSPSAASTRDFLRALGVILSRGVSEDGAGGTGLVPYLDFANHGEAGKNSGEGGKASCERGFDAATGTHFLRALRDIPPGEELLIDYGSTSKGIYRFARTYGFIAHSTSSGGGGEMSTVMAATTDMLQVDMADRAKQSSPLRDSKTSKMTLRVDLNELSAAVCAQDSSKPSEGSRKDHTVEQTSSGENVGTPDMVETVGQGLDNGDVSKVMTATTARPASKTHTTTEKETDAGVVDGGSSATAAVCHALEDRLRRYETTLEKDLKWLRAMPPLGTVAEGSDNGLESFQKGARRSVGDIAEHTACKSEDVPGVSHDDPHEDVTAGAAGHGDGAVTPEWVELCVRVRAAEKMALRRALRQNGSSGRIDGRPAQ